MQTPNLDAEKEEIKNYALASSRERDIVTAALAYRIGFSDARRSPDLHVEKAANDFIELMYGLPRTALLQPLQSPQRQPRQG